MTSFFSRLEERVWEVDSLLCVGLDPHPQDLPAQTPEAAAEYCYRLIRSAADQAACFKPNAAFFEIYGSQGVEALRQVIAAIPGDIPVILDAKRGDIASTAQAYAQSVFRTLEAHAVTVNPYLGYDSIEPFLQDPAHGVFLLCKTSNPGSADLQDLKLVASGDHVGTLYEEVARLARDWNQQDNLGLVVGATQPEALRRIRAIAPDMWILAPGIGAQGGDLQRALVAGLRQDGSGLLLPVSRLLSRSPEPGDSAQQLRVEINRIRERILQSKGLITGGMEERLYQLADKLLEAGCIQFGKFTLKSGLESPVYIDLRRLVSDPELLSLVAAAYLPVLKRLSFDHLAALPYAAIPIATAISLLGGWSLIYPRKEVKNYGTRADIEGVFRAGERVVVIDDLATTGGSKFEAIEKLSSAGLQVQDVVVLVDRQSGASLALSQQGYQLHAIFTLSELLDYWESTGEVSSENIQATRLFLSRGSPER